MKLYHICIKDSFKCINEDLHAGQTISLFNDLDKILIEFRTPQEVISSLKIIRELLPNGLSQHGYNYTFLPLAKVPLHMSHKELSFEMMRQLKYKDNLSRFQTFFAVDKENFELMLARLNLTLNEYGKSFTVFEVKSEYYERRDMSLLDNEITNSTLLLHADLYWKGECSEEPIYEYLLKPPVKIIREVSLADILSEE